MNILPSFGAASDSPTPSVSRGSIIIRGIGIESEADADAAAGNGIGMGIDDRDRDTDVDAIGRPIIPAAADDNEMTRGAGRRCVTNLGRASRDATAEGSGWRTGAAPTAGAGAGARDADAAAPAAAAVAAVKEGVETRCTPFCACAVTRNPPAGIPLTGIIVRSFCSLCLFFCLDQIVGLEAVHTTTPTETENVLRNFLADLRRDERYSQALFVILVENNLSFEAYRAIDVALAPGQFEPTFAIFERNKAGEPTKPGIRTDDELKRQMYVKTWRLLEGPREGEIGGELFFERKLIGRSSEQAYKIFRKELEMFEIKEEPSKNGKVKYTLSGKPSGPDDLVLALFIGLNGMDVVRLHPRYLLYLHRREFEACFFEHSL